MNAKIEYPESFKDADYFDCGDPEDLTHDCPEEALERWFDSWCTPGCGAAGALAVIREQCPVTVTAYKRKTINDGFSERLGKKFDHLIDDLCDDFSERYSDPNGDNDAPCPRLAELDAMKAKLVEFFGGQFVWQCEPCGSVELTAEQCIDLLKDWIDE